jgi:4-carboxymuconolactone decarboxylase
MTAMRKITFSALFLTAAFTAFAQQPAGIDPQSYSRLPLIPRDQLDANGQKIFDAINGPGQTNPRLGPPANSLYALAPSEPYDRLNQLLRKTVAGPRFFEICTLIAAREYDQQYEWTGHEIAAQRAGVEQNIIDTIKFNRGLEGLPEKEATIIQYGRDLFHKHKVDLALYNKVVELFGRQGMMELTMTIGDYAMTAILLNAVDQQLPPDRKPLLWPLPASNAFRLSKYILTVSDLDKTYAFYHDALGIELTGNNPKIGKPQAGAGANTITGSPAESSFRNANTHIPGADFNFEWIELTGQPRVARHPRLQDPGAAVLVLNVRDADAALAAVKKAGAEVVTLGGAPMALRPGQKSRAVFVKDPDGFYVELLQLDPQPPTTAPADSMVTGARWGTVVEDAAKSAAFYRDNFGLDAKINNWVSEDNLMRLAGLEKAQLRIATVQVPGKTEVWEFFEFKDVERKPAHFNVPDPGSLQLGFQVQDVDAAAAVYKSAGGAIVSKGGEIIRRPNGALALMRDPDGVYLEVVTAPR